jgi:ADP-ribose pyrophosphatase YjhB (NUDIX family)
MKCDKCGYVYFHNTASSVAGIIETGRGIVLTKRNISPKKGFLDLPGGFAGYNESLETALVREIKEELGCDVSDCRYFGSFPNVYVYRGVTYHTVDIYFVCTVPARTVMRPNAEISDIVAVPIKNIPYKRLGFESTRQALLRYEARKR